jgi:hypothetical protein
MALSVFGEYYSFIGRAFRIRYTVRPRIEFTYKREKIFFFDFTQKLQRNNVSVTIVLMVMLMLLLARIFRTLVKRSTVHNNGDGDVNVRNDVKRSRK